MSTHASRRPIARICASLLMLGLFTATGDAQRGGGGGPAGPQVAQAVGLPRFEYVGPTSAGRIAAAAAVAGQAGRVLRRRGVRRRVEIHRWRRDVEADVRHADVAGDRRACRVAQQSRTSSGPAPAKAWAVRDMDMMGDGIYKSTDAGDTWTNMGLAETGRIGTVVVHPTNENIVMVCALGRATGPQKERGVFRTEDGGKTWQQVLFVDQNTGCSGLQISFQDPNVVIAGTWEIQLQTHVLESGGMGSGIYISQRRRQHVRQGHASRPAEVAVRQDGRGHRAVERQPHVCADPDRCRTA